MKEANTTGILRTFRRSERDNFFPFLPHIQAAGHDLFFLGNTLLKLLDFKEYLKDKAENGIPVRLLLPDPCEKEMVVTLARFWNEVPSLFGEFVDYYGKWCRVWEDAKIQVRACPYYPPFSASMFDRKIGAIELFMREWSFGPRIMLELDLENGAKDVMKNLDDLWNVSTSLCSKEAFDKRIMAAEKLRQEFTAPILLTPQAAIPTSRGDTIN